MDISNRYLIHIFRTVILLAAVVMIILGLLSGEYIDVKSKAIRICLECIGIG